MKARVKATGETIEIMQVYEKGESFYVRLDMLDTTEVRYHISELEFEGFETEGKFAETCLNGIKQGIVHDLDYWTRLEHQAAIAAMQGILACEEWKISPREGVSFAGEVALQAHELAHALVEKVRYEENPKELEGLKKELEALKIEKTILENKIKLLKEERK